MNRRSRSYAIALVTLATFTDLVAYSIAIPVLPDLSRRLGASAAMIGLLFGSFGVTLLTVAIPMGAASDRLGRKGPMIGGMAALALASLLFAMADSLPWLFAARLVQGAADAITWVVGFALIADLYEAHERGRVMGIVMMGTSFAIMIGPTLGGWLYEVGGIRLPFLFVAAMATLAVLLFAMLEPPRRQVHREPVPVLTVLRVPAVAACALVVIAISSTVSMLEPVLSFHLNQLGVRPGRVGVVYGVAAVVTTSLHPFVGRMADRFGARRMTIIGLVLIGVMIPVLGRAWSYPSALVLYVMAAAASAFVITPSLAFMSDAVSSAGIASFGVAYGLYNMAWGAGLLGGPAAGGVLYERLGFSRLCLVWFPALFAVVWLLAGVQSSRPAEASAPAG